MSRQVTRTSLKRRTQNEEKETTSNIIDYIFKGGETVEKETNIEELQFLFNFPKRGSRITEIVWTKEMERIRDKILEIRRYLSERMGLKTEEDDWVNALIYGMIASSDYTKPPVVIHVIGKMGTFKTYGPQILAETIKNEKWVLTYEGAEVEHKYDLLKNTLSEALGIPEDDLDRKEGGIISYISTLENKLEVKLDIPFAISILKKKGGSLEDLKKLKDEIKNMGFTITAQDESATVKILDPPMIYNIDDNRKEYRLDQKLGYVTSYSLFKSDIAVIDEGSRTADRISDLFTQMSTRNTLEKGTMIVVTDNLEPAVRVMNNTNLSALHDRVIRVTTTDMRDQELIEEAEKKKPPSISRLELQAALSFIESIPFPRGYMYLLEVIRDSLNYKYAIRRTDDRVTWISPLERDMKSELELDVFEEYGDKLKFIDGNRLVEHTERLAKFFAFMRRHRFVELDDFEYALTMTLFSRIALKDINSYDDYAVKTWRLFNRIREVFLRIDRDKTGEGVNTPIDILETSRNIMELIAETEKSTDIASIEYKLSEILEDISLNPVKAVALYTSIKYLLKENLLGEELLLNTPPLIKYTGAEIISRKTNKTIQYRYNRLLEEFMRELDLIVEPES